MIENVEQLKAAPDGALLKFAGGDKGWIVGGRVVFQSANGVVGTVWPWEIRPEEFPAEKLYPVTEDMRLARALEAVVKYAVQVGNEAHEATQKFNDMPKTADESNVRMHVRLRTEAVVKKDIALKIARMVQDILEEEKP